MSKVVEWNINDYVWVKLTATGHRIHLNDHNAFAASYPSLTDDMKVYRPPETDADGWTKFQGWRLMQLFGPHIYLGGPNPFETTVRLTNTSKGEQ